MDSTDLGTPITSSYWDNVNLGIDQSTLDGNLNFLSALDTNTNVTSLITSGNNSLESCSLTGLGLLLHGQDTHNLIGQFSVGFLHRDKLLDNWCLLDWDGVGVDFFEGFDVASSHQSTELGKWSPVILVTESATWASSSSTATASSAASVTEASSATSATTSATSATSGIIATFSGGFSFSCTFHA
jgi:hypothetical protein